MRISRNTPQAHHAQPPSVGVVLPQARGTFKGVWSLWASACVLSSACGSVGTDNNTPLDQPSASISTSSAVMSSNPTALASTPAASSAVVPSSTPSPGVASSSAPQPSTVPTVTSAPTTSSAPSSEPSVTPPVPSNEADAGGGNEDAGPLPEPSATLMPMPSASMAAPDPLTLAERCTSGDYWERGENAQMRPGEACVECHVREQEGPRFSIAGTLYPTGHEPDRCNGVGPAFGAQIVITDANGKVVELDVNAAGNFTYTGSIAAPYTAKVVSADGERPMITPQTNGDCNTCHAASGGSAPARIVVPF
jgi:hypothetical protein